MEAQKEIVRLRGSEGRSAKSIHEELKQRFGEACIGYSTVTKVLRAATLEGQEPQEPQRMGRPPIPGVSEAIMQCLQQNPNFICRQIA